MRSQFIRSLGLAAVAAVLWCADASATLVNNTTGLTNPWQTVTFSELTFAAGTAFHDTLAAPFDSTVQPYAGLGLTFRGAGYYPSGALGNPLVNNSDQIGNFAPIPGTTGTAIFDPFTIGFTSPQTAAAFQLQTQFAGNTTVTALLNGNVVESFVVPTTNPTTSGNPSYVQYIGFEDIVFDTIVLTNVPTDAGSCGGTTGIDCFGARLLADNVQSIGIPEPATLAVLGGGLLAFGLANRRRRRSR